MKRTALFLIFLSALPLAAQDPVLRDQLRDALYTEEVTRDPAAAAGRYEEILAGYADQRALAATALFRLAEIRAKQDRKEEAATLYQRFLREFPDFENETKLARAKLAAQGSAIPDSGSAPAADEESLEIQRLEAMLETAPDLLRDPQVLLDAIGKGRARVVDFLLSHGADKNAPQGLTIAAEKGYLNICRIILKYARPTREESGSALVSAILNHRESLLLYLLENGLDVNSPWQDAIPLHAAAAAGDVKATTVLLDHGADINFMATPPATRVNPFEVGTPLHAAVFEGHLPVVRLLLDRGALPDLPSPQTNVTPLHLAANPEKNRESMGEIVDLLLAKGADVNRRTAKGTSPWCDHSPLDFAVIKANVPLVKTLLAHKADPNSPQADGSNVLLNIADANPPFPIALEMFRLLLDAGAEPEPGFYLLHNIHLLNNISSKSGYSPDDFIDLLVSHGAKPPQELIDQNFSDYPADLRSILIRKFIYPAWSNPASILLSQPDSQKPVVLLYRKESEPPPTLLDLLLPADKGRAAASFLSSAAGLDLYRKNDKGVMAKTELPLTGSEPLPALRWGDILEVRPLGRTPRKASGQTPDLEFALRKRLSIPITLEASGQMRALTLRGDVLVFNPTSDALPLFSASRLIRKMASPPYTHRPELSPAITVTRSGWGDIALDNSSVGFQLQSGDRVRVVNPPALEEEMRAARKKHALLAIAGTGTSWSYGDDESLPQTFPTLIQALVDCQTHTLPPPPDGRGDPTVEIPASLGSGRLDYPLVLPWPDLSHIRLRRLDEKGQETVVNIDLATAIARCQEDTPASEVKKSDVLLRPGDIVELTLGKVSDTPWKGPYAREARFFRKALSGTVQIYREGTPPVQFALNWQPPQWLEAEGGPIPIYPPQGISSTCYGLLGKKAAVPSLNALTVERDSTRSNILSPWNLHLRDGDRVYESSNSIPSNRPRIIRPSVLPAPPAR